MLKRALFNHIHGSNLVYNTCWEDPRCDRALLQLDTNSRVVMITSAGCNALDYVLDGPQSIDCVDINPRQNALLELKKAMYQSASHAELYGFFGHGAHREARSVFNEQLRPGMDSGSARYWAPRLKYFSGKGLRRSFYYYGSSGLVAYLLKNLIHTDKRAAKLVYRLLESEHLAEQREWYAQLEPLLFRPMVNQLIKNHLTQSLIGVPSSQQQLAKRQFENGMAGYVQACFRQVFTQIPIKDNYFWKLYFYGHYDAGCAPNYLQAHHFEPIRTRVDRIKTHTATLSNFLKAKPGQYTHFVLLDHQDWLASHAPQLLEEEWDLILQNSAPGAKYLMRSAAPHVDFIPAPIRERLVFDEAATAVQHQLDRVGTYASVHLATLNASPNKI